MAVFKHKRGRALISCELHLLPPAAFAPLVLIGNTKVGSESSAITERYRFPSPINTSHNDDVPAPEITAHDVRPNANN